MTPDQVGLILLASGLSSRFGGDKLMADLGGKALLSHTADMGATLGFARRFAVVGQDQTARKGVLVSAGWSPVINPAPEAGQGHSIARGVKAVRQAGLEAAMIILADMPCVPSDHLNALASELVPHTPAVMSRSGDRLMPPAIFAASTFSLLETLTGDQGARQILGRLPGFSEVDLDLQQSVDIDTPTDLQRVVKDL